MLKKNTGQGFESAHNNPIGRSAVPDRAEKAQSHEINPEKYMLRTIAYIITGMYFVSGAIFVIIYYLSSIDSMRTGRDLAVTGLMSFAVAPAMMIFGTVLVLKSFVPGPRGRHKGKNRRPPGGKGSRGIR